MPTSTIRSLLTSASHLARPTATSSAARRFTASNPHVAYPEHALYQLLPRLASMCEVQWCKPEQKDFEGWKKRLPQLKKLYDKLGFVYCNEVE